ncbi:MAG TPA: dTDP-glucose 4,6-dehydratase [Planctomycetota bacterium]|nr:dTDP-glucose 4,6-dehydratase [Planctomycetota bacterium]
MDHGSESRTVLITGGCGFIGSNLVRHLLSLAPASRVVNLDLLTYAGKVASLADLPPEQRARYTFVKGDICDGACVAAVFEKYHPEMVLHLAAESHVDRSITGPEAFVSTNLLGTQVLLSAARHAWTDRRGKRFHHVSTDEVFGSLGEHGRFNEASPYNPSSPYAASKAGADHLVRAYHHTYGLPVSISNASNNYGPWQFPEKLIPLLITHALTGRPLPIYGAGKNIRDWLHVEDHCAGIWAVATQGRVGETYNVGGGVELTNLAIAQKICALIDELGLGVPSMTGSPGTGGTERLIQFVADRPGHDFRYALDCGKIHREIGWRPIRSFDAGLRSTVEWYAANRAWWEPLVKA